LPVRIAQGDLAGQAYVVERLLPGQQGVELLTDRREIERVQVAAAATIRELHEATANSTLVDAAVVERWIERPLACIRRFAHDEKSIIRLGSMLRDAVVDTEVSVSWIHGDYWPGNLLVAPGSAQITGVIDWERALPGELPLHDVLHLLLYTRSLTQRRDLGLVVQDLLDGSGWTNHEQAILDADPLATPRWSDERIMILLYWLRHVASNLVQSTAYARRVAWWRNNVGVVLGRL
jgi:aminoglycoside phosphotransferase (APT) family kinase protein